MYLLLLGLTRSQIPCEPKANEPLKRVGCDRGSPIAGYTDHFGSIFAKERKIRASVDAVLLWRLSEKNTVGD